MDSMTERYIAVVTRHVPLGEREDVAEELRVSIEESIGDRLMLDPLQEPRSVEREALLALGDPGELDARYAGRPIHLLSARVYLAWRRTLTLLLSTLVPITMVGSAVASSLNHGGAHGGDSTPGGFAEALFQDVAVTGVNAAIHLCFWCTLLFVVLDRRGTRLPRTWSPDRLPPTSGRRDGTTGLIGAAVAGALVLSFVVIDAIAGLNVVGGQRTTILNPSLWPWGFALLAGIIAGGLLLAGVTWQCGPSRATAYANLVICGFIAVVVLGLLASQSLVNDATWGTLFRLSFADHAQTVAIGSTLLAAVTVALATWRIARGFRLARRPSSTPWR